MSIHLTNNGLFEFQEFFGVMASICLRAKARGFGPLKNKVGDNPKGGKRTYHRLEIGSSMKACSVPQGTFHLENGWN